MAEKEEFTNAWISRQYDQPPPMLDCLEADANGRLDMGSLSRSYSECQERIKELQNMMDQQNFISTFLWDLAHSKKPILGGRRPSSGFGTSVKIQGVPSETDLDTLVLADEDDKDKENLFYSYATLPDCDEKPKVCNDKASPATGDRPVCNDGAIKRTSQTGALYLNDVATGQNLPHSDSHLNAYPLPSRERLKTLEPPPTKDKPKLPGSFIKTGSIKSKSFDTGNNMLPRSGGSDCKPGAPGDRSSTTSIMSIGMYTYN